eukprot:TRINITY_DN2401_c0_g1_i4.p2 TRINITY_DN2401_c0_g1~~TRINITY_DN2401_c0_g1_i4.p2  ORF type:complete len:271 (+),score=30.52 TRINITY_DN2401_c0_g1_i4:1569-2381(+)
MGEESDEEDPGSDSNPSGDNLPENVIAKILDSKSPKATLSKPANTKIQKKLHTDSTPTRRPETDTKKPKPNVEDSKGRQTVKESISPKVRLCQRDKVCKTPSPSKVPVSPAISPVARTNQRPIARKALAPLIIKSIPMMSSAAQAASDSSPVVKSVSRKLKIATKAIINMPPSRSLEALHRDLSVNKLGEKYNMIMESIVAGKVSQLVAFNARRIPEPFACFGQTKGQLNMISSSSISPKHTLYVPRKNNCRLENLFPTKLYCPNPSRPR